MTPSKVLQIRNFEKFQHYKKRRPPWIKQHSALILDYPFVTLPECAKLTFFILTTVASEYDNRIPYDIEFLVKRMTISKESITEGLQHLLDADMVSVSKKPGRKQVASKPLAKNTQVADTEVETETETEERQRHTTGRGDARRVLSFLNEKSGKSFEPVESNLKLIDLRLKEAAKQYPNPTRLAALVIISKVNEANDKNEWFSVKHLRPSTLFGATKFWDYVGNLPKNTKESPDDLPAMQ